MRKLFALLLTFALFAAGSHEAFARSTKTIKVGDDFFVKPGKARTITVRSGPRVTFKWAKGDSLHNVHARKGPVTFRSSFKRKGSFSKVLRKKGTYRIFCDIHSPSMRITIKVK
jgi:plastocyanin